MAVKPRGSVLAKAAILLLPFITTVVAQNATLTVDDTTYSKIPLTTS